jgi:DNA-binding LacI/PurR family transcriptional regulator
VVICASMNIKEVAARARLSTATVSRTINQSELVRPRTAEKVRRAIRELGYYPNTQARALVSGRSQMFGLIISDIVNPFFPELVKSFEFAAIHRGYEVIIANTDYNSERMGGCVRRMIERKVDGVAIMTSEIDRHLLDQQYQGRLFQGNRRSSAAYCCARAPAHRIHQRPAYVEVRAHTPLGVFEMYRCLRHW